MPRLGKPDQDSASLHRRISRFVRPALLSERKLIVHSQGRIFHIRVSVPAQFMLVSLFVAAAAWFANVSYAYIAYDRIISAKDAALAARREANYALRRELTASRLKFAEVTDALAKNHRGLVTAIDRNHSLQGNLDKLRAEVRRIAKERDLAENTRLRLREQMAEMEGKVHRAQAQNEALTTQLESTGARLTSALNLSSKATKRETKLDKRVKKLYGTLSDLRDSQASLIERIADASHSEIARLKKILVSTGLNVKRLLRAQGVSGKLGQGGPFEPVDNSDAPPGEKRTEVAMVDANGLLDRLEAMQRVIRELPLGAPINNYRVSSPFGLRRDPVNGRIAMHPGVDLVGKYHAPIRATAAGRVIFAGRDGGYGRFVKINNGNGIVTCYGHLWRIEVKRGQKVRYREEIGRMGDTGRSTGMHLHYEIRVRGKAVDPLKFLRAGKDVFKG